MGRGYGFLLSFPLYHLQTARGCVSLTKKKYQGKVVEVTEKHGGKLPRFLSGFHPRIRTLYCTSNLIQPLQIHTIPRIAASTEWQWPLSGVHSIMMEKSAQPGEGGMQAHPLSPSHTNLWYTLQLRGQIHSSYFYSTPIFTLRLQLPP